MRAAADGGRRLRVGVVGAGIGAAHVAAFQRHPNAEVVALCARTPARLEAVGGRFGIDRLYTDVERMLASERVDIAVIATPDDLHRELTFAALEHGAHVLCEKPLALTARDAQAMADRAEAAGRRHAVGFGWRFFPAAAYMKSLVDGGFLGRPYLVEARYLTRGYGDPHGPMRWQYDSTHVASGAVGSIGSHAIDLVQWWLGDIERLTSLLTTAVPERSRSDGSRAPVNVDDTASFLGELDGGVPVAFTASWVTYVTQNFAEIRLHGSEGMLVFQADAGAQDAQTGRILATRRSEPGPSRVRIPARFIDALDEMPRSDTRLRGAYGRLAAELLEAVLVDRPATPSFHDGVRVQAVLDAVLESSRTRRWATVAPAPPAGAEPAEAA